MIITKKRAQALVNAIISLRDSATDEQAINAAVLYPTWQENQAYEVGARVVYNDTLYRVITAHTSQVTWTPADAPSLFAKVLIPDENVIPEWEQPDSTNPYKAGDKVTHNGKTYISNTDGNVWEPGVYGWDEV